MSVIDVIDSNEFKNSTSTGFAVVDYSAVWCGPCKRVEPVFKELAQNNKKIKFLHIDIDHASETEGLSDVVNKIRSVPTFHFYRDGKIIDVLSGGNIAQLKSKVDSLSLLVATQQQIELAAAAAAHKKEEKQQQQQQTNDEQKQLTHNNAAAAALAAAVAAANSPGVIEINTFEEFKGYLLSGLAVVDYSATWCGPCKRLEPVFKELAQTNKNIKFLHIDIDHASETEGLNRLVGAIRSVPTFHFYRDGKVVDTLSGANIIQLKNKVEYLNSLAVVIALPQQSQPQPQPQPVVVEKRNEEKQDDNKIEKKKAKTEQEIDEKREKYKSKSPDHHRHDDNTNNNHSARKTGAMVRESSRKRVEDTLHHPSIPVAGLAPAPAPCPVVQAAQKSKPTEQETAHPENQGGTGGVIEIEDSIELINLTQSGLAVIDYSATWCGPCKIVAPVFKELASHYRAIKFLHIDIDHAAETEGLSELVDKIRSVPTFHFYRDGKIIDFLYGGNVSQLKIKIDALNTLGAMVAAANEKKAAMIAANNAAIAAANAAAAVHHQNADPQSKSKQAQTQPTANVQQPPAYQQLAAAVAAANHHQQQQQQQQTTNNPIAAAAPSQMPPPPPPPPAQPAVVQPAVQPAAPAPAQPTIAVQQLLPTNVAETTDADQKKIAVAAAAIVAAATSKQIEKELEKEKEKEAAVALKKEEKKSEEVSTEIINPIVDAYNSIDFINATATGLALVDYSAVWCPPCVRVQPILKDIAQNYKNIKFIHVDIDHAADTDLAELVDKISSVPTFHFYSDGRVIDTLQGANIAQLRSKVENLNTCSLAGPTAAAAALLNSGATGNAKNDSGKKDEKKKKSKSSGESNAAAGASANPDKKSTDKKKKRRTKKKDRDGKSAPATTTTKTNNSNADPTSAATTATINE